MRSRQWTAAVGIALVCVVVGVTPLGAPPANATALRARKVSASATGDEMVKAAQQALREKGYEPGNVDGRLGPKTQQAIRVYQSSHGLTPTGRLDLKTLIALGVETAD